MRRSNCLLCGSFLLHPLKKFHIHNLVRCIECNFVFSEKVQQKNELKAYYQTYAYDRTEEFISKITLKRYIGILEKMSKFRLNNRLLDVGCGSGIFLSVAQSMGWECYGVELSEAAVNLCYRKGLTKVQYGELQDVVCSLPEMDIVVMIEVIEHMADPIQVLKLIRGLLRSGGLMYLTTPNFNSLERYLLGERYSVICYPEHLNYFTKSTIKRMLKNCGFVVQKCESTGLNVSELKAKFIMKEAENDQRMEINERVRSLAEHHKIFSAFKFIVNRILNILALGNSLKVWAVKNNS